MSQVMDADGEQFGLGPDIFLEPPGVLKRLIFGIAGKQPFVIFGRRRRRSAHDAGGLPPDFVSRQMAIPRHFGIPSETGGGVVDADAQRVERLNVFRWISAVGPSRRFYYWNLLSGIWSIADASKQL